MATFDQKMWISIGARLKTALPGSKVDTFALTHGLEGVRLDRIASGRKGATIETIVMICDKLDLSPSWLLMGKGPRDLSDLDSPTARKLSVKPPMAVVVPYDIRDRSKHPGVSEIIDPKPAPKTTPEGGRFIPPRGVKKRRK